MRCFKFIFSDKNKDCSNRGSLTCKCNAGYTGEDCEAGRIHLRAHLYMSCSGMFSFVEVDYCAELVTEFQAGPIPAGQLCQPHGYCISTDTGAVCICEYGYTGEFCHDGKIKFLIYLLYYLKSNSSVNISNNATNIAYCT